MRPAPIPGKPRSLGRWLAVTPHAYTRAELTRWWSAWSVDAATSRGTVERLLPGLYCGSEHVADARVRAEAVTLWSRRALVSGRSALHLYDGEFAAPSTVDIVLPHGSRVRAPEWVHVREQALTRTWSQPQGVRCVVPEQALLDAWHRSPAAIGSDLVYRALWQRVCTSGQLARALTAAPRVSGRRELMAILVHFAAGATSPLEVMARRDVFVGRRFAEFEWQAEAVIAGRRRRGDLIHRRARLVIELDGWRYHSGADAVARDHRRDAEFAAAGFTTLRLTFEDVRNRPEWCRDTVLSAVAARL